MGKYSNYTVS